MPPVAVWWEWVKLGHAFVPFRLGDDVICAEAVEAAWGGKKGCGKTEDEHAPADDRGEDELERASG